MSEPTWHKKDSREWITLNETHGIKYRKIKDDVEIIMKDTSNTEYSGYLTTVLGTLPKGYRPNITLAIPVYSNITNNFKFIIDSNGAVSIYNWGSAKTPEDVSAYIKFAV